MLRYKEDPWLWDLEWDVQAFKQKKVATSKKKNSKKAVEQVATPLPEWEEGMSLAISTEQSVNSNRRFKWAVALLDPGPPSEEEMASQCPSRAAVEKLKETVSQLPKKRQHLPGYPG